MTATDTELDDAPRSEEACPCARRLEAGFDCRSPDEECPRLLWLRLFEDTDASPDDRRERARSEIRRMATALGLPPDVPETAVRLFDHARSEGLLSGRSVEGVATAALYGAARQTGLPRTLDEFAAVSKVDRSVVGHVHGAFGRELDLSVEPVAAADLVPRYADRLDMAPVAEQVAVRIATAGVDRGLQGGHEPASLAAAAVYAAGLLTDDPVSQQRVADAVGVSEPTVGHLYRELLDDLSIIDD